MNDGTDQYSVGTDSISAGMAVPPVILSLSHGEEEKMKRASGLLAAWIIVLTALLGFTACHGSSGDPPTTQSDTEAGTSVKWIYHRQFWHDDEASCFVLVYSLLDPKKNEIAAPGTVDIRIVNENDETVFSDTRTVASSDFTTFSYDDGSEDRFQAVIYINDSEITPGSIDSGMLYFKVHGEDYSFNESSLPIYRNLPLKETTIILPSLPLTVSVKYGNSVASTVNITNITCETVNNDLFLYFTGEKTYDRTGSDFSQGCTIEWKLYDSEGYLVKSSHFFTESISVGDKFKDGKDSAYGCITPGETYTLIIANADSKDTD